jgi:transcriptional regulator with XRE-family HTH domain
MAAGKRRAPRRTAKEHGPDPIDIHVGSQVRLARALAGLTQAEFGRKLGMSFQLVQKYEQGEIRVAASRLYRMACVLGKPIEFFYAGLADGGGPEAPERQQIELVRAFRNISPREVRKRFAALVKNIAGRKLTRRRRKRTRVPGAKG